MNIYLILCAIISLISIPYGVYKVKKSKRYRRRNTYKITDSNLKTSDFSEKSLNSEEKKHPIDIQTMIIKGDQQGDKQTLLHMRNAKKINPTWDFKTYMIKTEGRGDDKLGEELYKKRGWTKHKQIWDKDKLGKKRKSKIKKPRKTKKK